MTRDQVGSVTVLFFAAAAEAVGKRREEVEGAAGRSLAELVERLFSSPSYGDALAQVLPSCAIWVNGTPASRDSVLQRGDEVAVLPPVSGGSGECQLQPTVPAVASSLMGDQGGLAPVPTASLGRSLGLAPEASLGRVFHPNYLDRLEQLPMPALRTKRVACTELETELSYLRRLVQARVDLVVAERERRRLGLSELSPEALVEQLPQILGMGARGEGPGRLPHLLAPAEEDQAVLTARVERVLPSEQLSSLGALLPEELDTLLEKLSELEREVSAERRLLHDIQDRLQEELVRRYRSGEASVDALLP
jgi:molybdopterin converting factor small subunit